MKPKKFYNERIQVFKNLLRNHNLNFFYIKKYDNKIDTIDGTKLYSSLAYYVLHEFSVDAAAS